MRRIVTGVNENGKSYVVSNEQLAEAVLVDVWDFDPTDIQPIIASIPDGVAAESLESVPGGANMKVITIPPAGGATTENVETHRPGRDEDGWHITRTLDFIYIAAGSMTLRLDEESVHIGTGDVVVQRATRHSWQPHNEDSAVVMLAILITPNRA